jgi:hypothetical protein
LNKIEVQGCWFRPKLTLVFDKLQVVDTLSERDVKIRNTVKIFPWQAILIQKILLQNFKAILTTKRGRYLESVALINEEGLKLEPMDLNSTINDAQENSVVALTKTKIEGLYPCLQQFENKSFQNDEPKLPVEKS